jgi:RIO kinase 1
MSYHGDELLAAPTLNTVALEPNEAQRLYREVLRNVDLMLQHDLIHGDLSAYNILYWQPQGFPAEITFIDFPQVVNLRSNENARAIFERDMERTCEYFAQQGVDCRASEVVARLWSRYVTEIDPEDRAADWSRLLADLEELPGDVVLDPIPL